MISKKKKMKKIVVQLKSTKCLHSGAQKGAVRKQ